MASISNTLITSYDYLLRNCYSVNRNARKAITRTTMKQEELIQADASALKKITRNLRSMDYNSDNSKNIYNSVKVFVESYNNLIESGEKTSSAQLDRTTKKLKNFIKEHKDELKELGLNVSSSGKITIKDSTLSSTTASKISKVFSSSSNFTSTISQYATKISRYAKTLRTPNPSAEQPSTDDDTPTVPIDPPVSTNSIMTANRIDYRA